MTIRRILIPHDFSISAAQVLDYGVELALTTGAHLHFLHVEIFHQPSLLGDAEDEEKAERLREKLLDDLYESLESQGAGIEDLRDVTYAVEQDYAVAPAIDRYSLEHDIDLIMMGTHGRRAMARALEGGGSPEKWGPFRLGSVAEAVVRTAPCSVFTIREQVQPRRFSQFLRRITVPLAFNEKAVSALQFARDLAVQFGAVIEVVHVVETFETPRYIEKEHMLVYDTHQVEKERKQQMRALFRQTEGPRVDVRYTVLHGHPEHEILKRVEQRGSDLIVLAPNIVAGRWEEGIGSTVERIVRMAPCPVVTVKPTERTTLPEPSVVVEQAP